MIKQSNKFENDLTQTRIQVRDAFEERFTQERQRNQVEYAQLTRTTEQNFKALKEQCLFDLNRM